MIDLKGFRRANKLNQQVVADFLRVSRGYISLVETGASKLSDSNLELLLANTMGWDTSMLLADSSNTSISAKASGNSTANVSIGNSNESATELALLKAEVESLKAQLAVTKEEKDKYWEMIQKLLK